MKAPRSSFHLFVPMFLAVAVLLPPSAARAQGWTRVQDMPTGRMNAASAVAQDASGTQKIFVIGGGQSFGVNTVESYDPASDTWTAGLSPMPTARADLAAVTYTDGKIYAIAGSNAGGQAVESYDPVAGTWATGLPPLPFPPRMGCAAAVAKDGAGEANIYVMGGLHGFGSLNRVDFFHPVNGWQSASPMLASRWRLRAVTGADGKIYVFGGGDPRIERYDPVSNTWVFTGQSLPAGYSGHDAVLACNGKIYIVGGDAVPCSLDSAWTYAPGPNVLDTTSTPPLGEARGALCAEAVGNRIFAIGGYRKLCGYADQITERYQVPGCRISLVHAVAVRPAIAGVAGTGVIDSFPVEFELRNAGAPFERLEIEIAVAAGEGASSLRISLDGLPPGEPVRGAVDLPDGERAVASVEAAVLPDAEAGSGAIELRGDTDGDGLLETLARTLVTLAPPCPDGGETSCEGIEVEGPPGGGAGTYRVTAHTVTLAAAGISSEDVELTFLAQSFAGDLIVHGPTDERSVELELDPGTWWIAVSLEVDPVCGSDSDSIDCSTLLEVRRDVVFRRGDSNADGRVDLADSIRTLGHLFLGGPASSCRDSEDTNDDGGIDIGDPIFGLSWQFLGGPPPPAPGASGCGVDPTADALDCVEYSACR